MGNSFDGASGSLALKKAEATDVTHAFIGNDVAARLVFYYSSKSLKLDAKTNETLENFATTAKKVEKGMRVFRELYNDLLAAEKTGARAAKEAGGTISPAELERDMASSVETLIGMGFKKEEASYLVGKAVIEMGLKQPMKDMLGIGRSDADMINAYMARMRGVAYAKEQKEKAEGDLKNVLAEHNVTERKYESA